MKIRTLGWLRKNIVGHTAIAQNKHEILFDNGITLRIQEGESNGTKINSNFSKMQLFTIVTHITDIQEEKIENKQTHIYGKRAVFCLMHHQYVLCEISVKIKAGWEEDSYSSVYITARPYNKNPINVYFTGLND